MKFRKADVKFDFSAKDVEEAILTEHAKGESDSLEKAGIHGVAVTCVPTESGEYCFRYEGSDESIEKVNELNKKEPQDGQ